MSEIIVERPSEKKCRDLKIPDTPRAVHGWSVWECEPSTFDWHYSDAETAYLYEGRVKVKTSSQQIEIKAGDLVIFPKGLDCTWQVLEKIRKVYQFR